MKTLLLLFSCLLLLHSAASQAAWLNGEFPPFQKKIIFSLIDQHKQPFSSRQLEGRYSLIFFGYSTCSNVCPTSLQTAARVKNAVANSEPINVVFITLDPLHDTAETIASYLAAFDKDIIGLSGRPKEINNAATAFSVKYRKRPTKEKSGSTLDHSGTLYMLDKSGKLLLQYPYPASSEKIIDDINYLHKNGKNWLSGRMSGAGHAEAH